MKHFGVSPVAMLTSLWRNRSLLTAFTKREVIGRYRGSFLGVMWSFFNPLLMLAVYTFVFGFVFKTRWQGGSESTGEFALILFSGLIIFNLFSDCVTRAPSLILSNANYVKKVVFPLEILPWVVMGGALFHSFVSLLVWLISYSLLFGMPHITSLFLPVILFPIILFTMGVSLILASLGVYLRDIGQVIGVIVTAMMFLSPLFFPLSSLPEEFQSLVRLNPLTDPIMQIRNILMWGKFPNWLTMGSYTLVAFVVVWLGFLSFQKTRKGFADVI